MVETLQSSDLSPKVQAKLYHMPHEKTLSLGIKNNEDVCVAVTNFQFTELKGLSLASKPSMRDLELFFTFFFCMLLHRISSLCSSW